ncbi:tRNA synthetases class I (M)-domain-containing protein [Pisolithus croceorrhizus]|nr:tRNA synthetases class I (M)-domain-containing protein [Pisolithus croceorrhizus]KAI6156489.1 tRNA synthetases class I (M)-domain-containing protein [Pisolithus thermaeus]
MLRCVVHLRGGGCLSSVALPRHPRAPRLHRCNTTSSTTEKPFYVTTPIFYPNARPHIGHLYSLVTADIIARYQRILNPTRPVVFLTGTDEHGLKVQQTALAKGIDPLDWCNTISTEFHKLAQRADVSGTVFARTTQESHKQTVRRVWRSLVARGLIYKDTYEGYYSTTDECFYPSSRISPHPTLPNTMIATETGSVVEWSREVNYKFRMSPFRDALLTHYSRAAALNAQAKDGLTVRGVCPDSHQLRITRDLEMEPLEDLSISRPRERIGWGISVPDDPTQTVYVWFDALLVYLSGIGYPGTGNAWPPDVQVIGKDIVRFHAIYLPAILLALKLPLPTTLLAHAHWTANQKKMSKSLGNVTDPMQAMDDYGVDAVRFYLARVGGRFRDDVDWSEEQLRKHTDEIRNLLGNYFLRMTSRIIKNRAKDAISVAKDKSFRGLLSQQLVNVDLSKTLDISAYAELDAPRTVEAFLPLLDSLGGVVSDCMKNLEVAESLHAIVQVLRYANTLLTNLAPWSEEQSATITLSSYLTALETLRIVGILLQPFLPGTAAKLLGALGVPEVERSVAYARVGASSVGGEDVLSVKGLKLFSMPAGK